MTSGDLLTCNDGYPAGRYLAHRQPSADLRRFDPIRDLSGPAGRAARPARIHRPALQRADFRARRRPWRGPAPRICDGVGRDVAGRIHRLPADRIRPSRGLLCRRFDSFSVHRLAPSAGMLAAGSAAYTDLKNLCVWAKNNGGMGSLYRSQSRGGRFPPRRSGSCMNFVFVFKSGTAPHINNVELGKHGRYRTNVWSYVPRLRFERHRVARRSRPGGSALEHSGLLRGR